MLPFPMLHLVSLSSNSTIVLIVVVVVVVVVVNCSVVVTAASIAYHANRLINPIPPE